MGEIQDISNYSKAVALHEEAMQAAMDANNLEFRVYSLNMLGVVYRRSDAIKIALDYNQEALELAESEKIFRRSKTKHKRFPKQYRQPIFHPETIRYSNCTI